MEWFYDLKDPILETIVGSFLIFVVVIIVTRIIGLRSFAKFTNYDFAFTIAVGSIISATLTSSTSIVHGSVAIASLLVLTLVFSVLQKKISWLKSMISNKPILLMNKDKILFENLKRARVEKSQLIAKLREANVLDFSQVEAVVMETTGDISVLHKSNNEISLDAELLEGVQK